MPETDFAAEMLETEIVLTHIGEGHVYHFPITPNGTVGLNGSRSSRTRMQSMKLASISSTPTVLPEQHSVARQEVKTRLANKDHLPTRLGASRGVPLASGELFHRSSVLNNVCECAPLIGG
jgi:hypothetical protein